MLRSAALTGALIVTVALADTTSRSTAHPRVTGRDRFGLQSGGGFGFLAPADQARELDAYERAGARWLRCDFLWSCMEPTAPVNGVHSYDWTRNEAIVHGAHARGIAVLGVIDYTPLWAAPPGATTDKYPPVHPEDYASFCGAVAAHFAPMGVHCWEIWNEPNGSWFWLPKADPVAYTRLLELAYAAIKRADPKAFVITGGTASVGNNARDCDPRDFLAAIYANGGKGSFDAVGHHPYTFPWSIHSRASWNGWHKMDRLRAIMVAHGDRAKRIWATEFGAVTGGDPRRAITEASQARLVRDAYRTFASYPWAGPLFWYNFRDNGTDPTNVEDHYGIVRFDFSPKPAFAAYQRAVAEAKR